MPCLFRPLHNWRTVNEEIQHFDRNYPQTYFEGFVEYEHEYEYEYEYVVKIISIR